MFAPQADDAAAREERSLIAVEARLRDSEVEAKGVVASARREAVRILAVAEEDSADLVRDAQTAKNLMDAERRAQERNPTLQADRELEEYFIDGQGEALGDAKAIVQKARDEAQEIHRWTQQARQESELLASAMLVEAEQELADIEVMKRQLKQDTSWSRVPTRKRARPPRAAKPYRPRPSARRVQDGPDVSDEVDAIIKEIILMRRKG